MELDNNHLSTYTHYQKKEERKEKKRKEKRKKEKGKKS